MIIAIFASPGATSSTSKSDFSSAPASPAEPSCGIAAIIAGAAAETPNFSSRTLTSSESSRTLSSSICFTRSWNFLGTSTSFLSSVETFSSSLASTSFFSSDIIIFLSLKIKIY